MIYNISKEMIEEEFKKALEYRDGGKYIEAIDLLDEILKSKPEKQLNIYLVLGEIYLSIQEFDNGYECFKKAIIINKDSELASLGLFHSLMELNDLDGAFTEMDRFLENNHPINYKITLQEIFEQLDESSEKQHKDIVMKYYNLYCKDQNSQ